MDGEWVLGDGLATGLGREADRRLPVVLLSAGEEGTLVVLVRKLSFPFLCLLSKLIEIGICTHRAHSWQL